jgi:hypothetical protein
LTQHLSPDTGHSIPGGAATTAATQAPDLITGIVEMMGSVPQWLGYLDHAHTSPAAAGALKMIDGAGHSPHGRYPDRAAALVLSFPRSNARV